MSDVSDEIKNNFQTQAKQVELAESRPLTPIETGYITANKDLPNKGIRISSALAIDTPKSKAASERSPAISFFRDLFRLN